MSTRESAHKDHASQEAARALITLTPRPCSLAPAVCANCRRATRRLGTSRPRGKRPTSSTTSRPWPASMVRIRRARRRHRDRTSAPRGQRGTGRREPVPRWARGRSRRGPDEGTQHHGRSRNEYGNGQHSHVLLSPDVVTCLRPSLVSLRDLLSVSLAQEGLVQIAFPSFPPTSVFRRVGF